MLLVTHIIIALFSIGYTLFTVIFPSHKKISASQWLVGLTLGSGTALVISTHSGLVSACITGLIYLSFNVAGIAIASRRLATQESETE
jgi:hypothetical protein